MAKKQAIEIVNLFEQKDEKENVEMKSTRIMHDIENINSKPQVNVSVNSIEVVIPMAFQYVKTRNVKSPSRGTEQSGCFDFYIPEDLTLQIMSDTNPSHNITYILKHKGNVPPGHNEIEETKGYHSSFSNHELISMRVEKNSRILIPSGIHVRLPKNHAMIAFNKSGVANKEGLILSSCFVDQDYSKELFFGLINTNNFPVNIDLGRKIVQLAVIPINMDGCEEVSSLGKLYENFETNRTGGFGSTGLK